MKTLAINCGSSTLKFELFEMGTGASSPGQEQRLARGIVDRIGGGAGIEFSAETAYWKHGWWLTMVRQARWC
jgi:acetate kinase